MGTEHEVLIPNTLLATEAPYHLLSPQHWGQQSKDPDGTYCIIKHDNIIKWHGGTLTRQVKLDKNNNCGFICTSPSFQTLNKFTTEMNTLIQNDNNWHDIKRPKTIIDDEEAESVTLFNFEDSVDESNKLAQTHPEDNYQK